jgi:hypothetical protein
VPLPAAAVRSEESRCWRAAAPEERQRDGAKRFIDPTLVNQSSERSGAGYALTCPPYRTKLRERSGWPAL